MGSPNEVKQATLVEVGVEVGVGVEVEIEIEVNINRRDYEKSFFNFSSTGIGFA